MTTGRSVGAEVDVAVDAETAFMAFTDEMDLWWVRGPINFYDAARAVARRCEPGVGGRLLEVYDDATGDALELGRITVWEPGEHLAWQSSVDDVYIDVLFQPNYQGTTVRVEAHVPPEGSDRGGTSWVRVGPWWFGAWCARRETAPREPAELGRLALALYYARPATAARWLADVFGFETPDQLPDDDARAWIEFRVGNSSLMVFKLDSQSTAEPPGGPAVHVPWVYVDDIDAHYGRARAAGATIVTELASPWGLPFYVADDLEGNRWTFAQARPTMR